ncbi:hypothetical protein ID866_12560 [Astraeus odoratus]|nr:hypothetical protein ID866_12560 [Astraeus odoratus]
MDQGQHPPDFSTLGFAGLVDLVMADGGMAREQAIKALNQQWAEMHVPPADHATTPPWCLCWRPRPTPATTPTPSPSTT